MHWQGWYAGCVGDPGLLGAWVVHVFRICRHPRLSGVWVGQNGMRRRRNSSSSVLLFPCFSAYW